MSVHLVRGNLNFSLYRKVNSQPQNRCLWNVSFSFLASSGSLTTHSLREAHSTEGQQSTLFAAGCRELKMVRCSWYTQILPLVAKMCTAEINTSAFSLSVLNIVWACACKRYWKLKKVEVHANRSSFLPKKHCSLNYSSVVPPLIPWLHDITPTMSPCSNNFCLAASLAWKSRFSTAALLLLLVLGQVCVSRPIRTDRIFSRGELKETGAITVLRHWTVWVNRCVFWALKHVILFK